MAEPPLIKPHSEGDGNLVILGPWSNLQIVDARTGQVIDQGNNTGASNGRGGTFRFSAPGSAYNGVILVSNGQPISEPINLANRAYGSGTSFAGSSYRPDPGGSGDLSQGGVAGAISADLGMLSFNPASFEAAEPVLIDKENLETVDIFATADKAGERNKENIIQSFADARGVSREIIDEALAANKINLADINDFNAQQQAEAFASLGPDAANALNQGMKNISAFSEGRLPDALQNEILNQSTRAMQSQQSNITGGGISSSFGQRVANQMSINQRIGLQQSAINSAPSFLANALELRRGSPQKLAFDPNQEVALRTGIAGQISSAQNLAPATAISGEFQNAGILNQAEFANNATENQTGQFNSSNQFAESQYNASALTSHQNSLVQLDLFNQKEQQNYEQNVINQGTQTAADANTLEGATSNADANIASNEAAAANQATGTAIGSIPAAIDAVAGAYDTFFGEDEPEDTPKTDSGGSASTAPASVIVQPSTSAPSLPSPVSSSGSTVVTPPSQSVTSTVMPNGSPGAVQSDGSVSVDYDAEIDDYEPSMDYSTQMSVDTSGLSASPRSYAMSQTSLTKQNTNQIQAHKTARSTVPQMVDSTKMSSDQIQYSDGTTGFDVSKPTTDLKKVQGPIPAAITPDITSKSGNKVAADQKAITSAMKTEGKVAKPTADSPVFKSMGSTEHKLNSVYPKVSMPDTSWKDLGDDTAEQVLNTLDTIPLVNTLPTDSKGKAITNPKYYKDIALDSLINSLGEV